MNTQRVNKLHRGSIRLKDYNYAREGAYYVTVCVGDRKCLLGDMRNAEVILNGAGKMVLRDWKELPQRFPNIEMDEFIVMPNHLHGIINIVSVDAMNHVGAGSPRPNDDEGRGNRAPTLGQIVAYFKYQSTKSINARTGGVIPARTPYPKIWQRNYYEHIIRTETDLNKIREYIKTNPAMWERDRNKNEFY